MRGRSGNDWSSDETVRPGGEGYSWPSWADTALRESSSATLWEEPSPAKARPERRNGPRILIGFALAMALLLLGAAGGSVATYAWMTSDQGTADSLPQTPEPTPPPASPPPTNPSEPDLPSDPPAAPGEVDEDTGIPAGAVATAVLAIVDGDTIDTDLGRVRVYGIDTPEVGEPYSQEATARTAELAPPGSQVSLWRAPGSDDVDRYGRLVRTVYTEDGQDLGEVLVSEGLATAYARYSMEYVDEEAAAQAAGLGIWSGQSSMPSTAASAGSSQGGSSGQPWNEPGPDLDCVDIGQRVEITGPDYHNLDSDGDGWGCESYG